MQRWRITKRRTKTERRGRSRHVLAAMTRAFGRAGLHNLESGCFFLFSEPSFVMNILPAFGGTSLSILWR